MELCDIVERNLVGGKRVSLGIVDHLQAMLDRAQQPVRDGEFLGRGVVEPAGAQQSRDRIESRWNSHRIVATAVDHLLDLHEELDLADPAPPALQIIAGADPGTLSEVIANTRGDLPDLVDDAEIQRSPPNERMDGIEEALAEGQVAGTSAS